MTVTCECGKRMQVSDALAGKTVRCSNCGESIFVAAAPVAATAKKGQPESAGFYISPGLLIAIISIALLVIGGILFYVGPMRVAHQWDDMDLKARNTVMNLVTYTQKSYLSERGEFDPHMRPPAIERDAVIFGKPFFSFSMPQKVWFGGTGTGGAFSGYYDTTTGEVDGDVECGGYVIGGLAVAKKSTATLHIVAHEEPGKDPVVTADGKPLKFVPTWVEERAYHYTKEMPTTKPAH